MKRAGVEDRAACLMPQPQQLVLRPVGASKAKDDVATLVELAWGEGHIQCEAGRVDVLRMPLAGPIADHECAQ